VEPPDSSLKKAIVADERIQEAIDQTVRAFLAIGDDHAGLENAFRKLSELKRKAQTDKRLVPQLVYYEANTTDLGEGMMVYMIFHLGEITPTSVAMGLAPYVWEPNLKVRKKVHRRLRIVEDASTRRKPDFRHYYGVIRQYASGKSEQPTLPLISRMYELDPGEAMLTMMRVLLRENLDARRQIIWAEHVIADVLWKHEHKFLEPNQIDPPAADQLKKLSESPYWWARLYVAETMRQHLGFRQPEIIERLKKDEHLLVQKAVSFAPGLK